MPRQQRQPRLWSRKARADEHGRHSSIWIILDGGRQISTGCDVDDVAGAQRALAAYLNEKHVQCARSGPRTTDQIPVADVLTLYARDVAPSHRDPRRTAHALKRLGDFFANKTLADINGPQCRDYARAQPTDTTARRDLEMFRAAINHHRQEGLHDRIVSVVMPDKRPPRERWLTRSEAARLVWAAYRFRVPDAKGGWSHFPRRHIARFMLAALYTGSRAQVIAQAALQREIGRPYVDLECGILYRRPEGDKETKKRRPAVPVPVQLLAHLRRWKRKGGATSLNGTVGP